MFCVFENVFSGTRSQDFEDETEFYQQHPDEVWRLRWNFILWILFISTITECWAEHNIQCSSTSCSVGVISILQDYFGLTWLWIGLVFGNFVVILICSSFLFCSSVRSFVRLSLPSCISHSKTAELNLMNL